MWNLHLKDNNIIQQGTFVKFDTAKHADNCGASTTTGI